MDQQVLLGDSLGIGQRVVSNCVVHRLLYICRERQRCIDIHYIIITIIPFPPSFFV